METFENKKFNPNHDLENFILNSNSLELKNRSKIEKLADIRAVVFFGSSGSGKTFLVDEVRNIIEEEKLPIQIPKRYITRPPRLNDDLLENSHTTLDEFEEKADKIITMDPDAYNSWKRAEHASENIINWEREMENGRIEKYGFEKSLYYLNNRIKVLSANNALARNKDNVPYEKNEILWIGVYAPDDVRAQRLQKRSPDLSDDELIYRLGDSSENIKDLADILINNYGNLENKSLSETKELIKKIVAIKRFNYPKLPN